MYGKETKELKINNMARKSSAAPFKMKYTNGKKTDSTAFFQMANPPAAPNPAVDEAIKKQMEQKITQKVDQAVTPEEGSPVMQKKFLEKVLGPKGEGGRWKKVGKFAKKAGQVAATSLTHGLDAVYGTGKIAANTTIFAKSEEDKEKENTDNSLLNEDATPKEIK